MTNLAYISSVRGCVEVHPVPEWTGRTWAVDASAWLGGGVTCELDPTRH